MKLPLHLTSTFVLLNSFDLNIELGQYSDFPWTMKYISQAEFVAAT